MFEKVRFIFDGTPCEVKAACTVWSGGKSGDDFKGLPITIRLEIAGHEALDAELVVMIYERKSAIQTGRRGGGEAKCQRQGFVLPLARRFSFMTAFPGAAKALCNCAPGVTQGTR